MGWRDIGTGGGGGGANWLKVKAGEKAMIHVISSEPHSFNSHFFQQLQKGATCPGEGCPACALKDKDHRPRWQHALVVYSYADKSCKIWVMSNTTAEQVKNIYDTYKSLSKVDLAVSRTGSGLDTKYGVVPFGTKWKDAMLPAEVPDLDEVLKPATPEAIEQMLAGIDPATDFDPEKLESGAAAPAEESWNEPAPAVPDEDAAETPVDEAPAEPAGDAWSDTPAEDTPPPAPKATAPKAAAKPAAAAPNERLDLMKKVLHKFATHPKMKAPGAKDKIVLQIAKTKKTVSQLSVDELKRILALLK